MYFDDEDERQARDMERLQEQLVAHLHGMVRRVGNDEGLLADIAALYHRMFVGLQAAGFTEDQALMIVAHQGFGGTQARPG
jgi:hypothetical protein